MSSCLSSPPTYLPPPPEEEFTNRAPVAPCSMQVKPGPQSYLNCSACNTIAMLWSAGCVASPPMTESAHKISWRGCSLTIWLRSPHPPTRSASTEHCDGWTKEVQTLNPTAGRGRGFPNKTKLGCCFCCWWWRWWWRWWWLMLILLNDHNHNHNF